MGDGPLQDALARNKGRRMRPEWSARFEEATGRAVDPNDFADLGTTARLRQAFLDRMKSPANCVSEWPAESRDDVLALIEEMGERLLPTPVVLFSTYDEYIGALRVPSTCLISNVADLQALLGGDLCFASEELESGLCLEFNHFSDSGAYSRSGFYRLVTWGVFRHTVGHTQCRVRRRRSLTEG